MRSPAVCQRHIMRTRSIAILPIALLLACTPSDSAAGEHTTELTIVAVGGETAHTASLTCSPDGGTHPRPAHACAALEEAGGDFDALPSLGTACPAVHAPVWVAVTGSWHSDPVRWVAWFPNLCAATSGTAGVIDFV